MTPGSQGAGQHCPVAWLAAAAALAAFAWSLPAVAADAGQATQATPQSATPVTCPDCGVLRSVREVRTERKGRVPDVYVTSPQYQDARPFDKPLIGPAISLSWGAGSSTQPKIGAVGSPEMQQRLIDISYEITIRFDDGRFGLFDQDNADGLRPGDRVRVVKGRVERIPSAASTTR
ncbi:MAG TPA: hypothetical protein VML56_15715 [Burkholderiales bacterium]|nr:hypothetical protein [Burkholderiales bacterium]